MDQPSERSPQSAPRVPGRPRRWKKLTDEATSDLRRMILVGELRPGQRATQDELATLLDVSTMPVREALLRLVNEGFIETSPNRYYRVAPITKDDINDIYWMHSMLAGELTARACKNQTPELR